MSTINSKVLTLQEYQEIVASMPKPTIQQMESFAEFVCTAHSWYKHLPTMPPGCPFQFFLNPGIGLQLIVNDWSGKVKAISRYENGFHYSCLPTNEYRKRFGYLAYSRSVGTSVSLRLNDGTHLVPSDDVPEIFDPIKGTTAQVPLEVMDAGVAYLSGLVHIEGENMLIGRFLEKPHFDWTEESGGREVFAKIIKRCKELSEDYSAIQRISSENLNGRFWDLLTIDYPLYQLLEAERERQKRGIVDAISRVLNLL
jgi:hypothetical protein